MKWVFTAVSARVLLFSTMNRFVFESVCWNCNVQTVHISLCLSVSVQVKSISSICLSFNSTQKSSIWYYLISFHFIFFTCTRFIRRSEWRNVDLSVQCAKLSACIVGRWNEWIPCRFLHLMENENKETRAIETDRQFKKWMCMCIALLLPFLHHFRRRAKLKHTSFESWTNKSESLWVQIKFHGQEYCCSSGARCRSVCTEEDERKIKIVKS